MGGEHAAEALVLLNAKFPVAIENHGGKREGAGRPAKVSELADSPAHVRTDTRIHVHTEPPPGPLFDTAQNKPAGKSRNKKEINQRDQIPLNNRGTSQAYNIPKLKRDNPELAAKVVAGARFPPDRREPPGHRAGQRRLRMRARKS